LGAGALARERRSRCLWSSGNSYCSSNHTYACRRRHPEPAPLHPPTAPQATRSDTWSTLSLSLCLRRSSTLSLLLAPSILSASLPAPTFLRVSETLPIVPCTLSRMFFALLRKPLTCWPNFVLPNLLPAAPKPLFIAPDTAPLMAFLRQPLRSLRQLRTVFTLSRIFLALSTIDFTFLALSAIFFTFWNLAMAFFALAALAASLAPAPPVFTTAPTLTATLATLTTALTNLRNLLSFRLPST